MLQRTLHFAGGEKSRVIVVSIPDWSVTPFAKGSIPEGIAASIAKFNAVNREESAKSEVRYVDITPVSRVAVREPTLLVADGLHPSAAMYARWTALIVPSAQAALLER
jgi:lysophospholipase L1-like esterase